MSDFTYSRTNEREFDPRTGMDLEKWLRGPEDPAVRRSVFRRFTLFASGANKKYFELVPSEEAKYAVVGAGVFLTAFMAFVSVTVTVSVVAGNGTPVFVEWWVYLCGLVGAVIIFWMDRILVSSPMSQYRFSDEVLASLWNPTADTQWYATMTRALNHPGIGSWFRRVTSVFWAGLIRLVIALCFSFVVAEGMLMLAFTDDINERAIQIQGAREDAALDAMRQSYVDRSETLNEQILAASADGYPGLLAARLTRDQLELARACANTDVVALQNALQNESLGRPSTVTLCLGNVAITTDQAGFGPNAAERQRQLTRRLEDLGAIQRQLDEVNSRITGAESAAGEYAATNESRRSEMVEELDGLVAAQSTEAKAIQERFSGTGDLLLRIQAFHDIQYQPDLLQEVPTTEPSSPQPTMATAEPSVLPPTSSPTATPVPSAEAGTADQSSVVCPLSIAGWPCFLDQVLAPPDTRVGAYLISLRLLFLGIELIPILMKITLALRSRRPYDALDAALEERATINAMMLVDEYAVRKGADAEERASDRKSRRTGSGADFEEQVRSKRERLNSAVEKRSWFGWLRPQRARKRTIDPENRDEAGPAAGENGADPKVL